MGAAASPVPAHRRCDFFAFVQMELEGFCFWQFHPLRTAWRALRPGGHVFFESLDGMESHGRQYVLANAARWRGDTAFRAPGIALQSLDFIFECEYLDRALRPVVLPADDEVASLGVMSVRAEIATLKLEFDADTFPYFGAGLADRFAIWK